MTRPRLIALYLPQYHPIPENDAWWGKGFTEWTNVAKARPLFKGHYQPHLPADLGFYDLRVPEVRQAQADLAREAGIEGFCYWHYWFAGKQLLERPFNEVLASGKPDFPFCLAWANESWSGIWHGAPERTLIKQTYPGQEDHKNHFYSVLPAFRDPRYITIAGKPVFVLYKPGQIPDLEAYIELWQDLARENGLSGIYFVGVCVSKESPLPPVMDGWILDNFSFLMKKYKAEKTRNSHNLLARVTIKFQNSLHIPQKKSPVVLSYESVIQQQLLPLDPKRDEYPLIFPSWDNTPRSGYRGDVLENSTPNQFQEQLRAAVDQVAHKPKEKQVIFIKSWNEWAEGNYLEPDQKIGMGFLDAIRQELNG